MQTEDETIPQFNAAKFSKIRRRKAVVLRQSLKEAVFCKGKKVRGGKVRALPLRNFFYFVSNLKQNLFFFFFFSYRDTKYGSFSGKKCGIFCQNPFSAILRLKKRLPLQCMHNFYLANDYDYFIANSAGPSPLNRYIILIKGCCRSRSHYYFMPGPHCNEQHLNSTTNQNLSENLGFFSYFSGKGRTTKEK